MRLIKQLINAKVTACLFACSLVLGIASCSSDVRYDEVEPKPVTQIENLSSQDQIAVENLLSSISDLNAQYPSVSTRGAFTSNAAVGLADAAGYAAGGRIGAWAGSAIGSAAGPWGAIAGHLIGRKVGPYICTSLASGAAGWLCSKISTRAATDVDEKFEFVSIISDKDSIGYYHNQMMVKIGNDRSRYIDQLGSVNYELMYDDIVSYCHEIGQYDPSLDNPLIKSGVINQIRQLCEISKKYEMNPTDKNFVKEQCEFLKFNCNLSDSEVKLYKDFNVTLYEKCSTLSDNQIVNYSRDLNRIIEHSGVSNSIKESLKKSADLTINSSLCWKRNF